MKVHITNLYGMCGAAGKIQNMTADIAKNYLQYNELGIYNYPANSDSAEMLKARLDGIMASVSNGDIIIFQLPTWNGFNFEKEFLRRLGGYRGIKKIFFMHDVEPVMFGSNDEIFGRYIELYNQADLIILPSKKMADLLRERGLSVDKIIIQGMWDSLVSIDTAISPKFKRVIHFAGNINSPKFSFAKEWKYDTVKLAVTGDRGAWAEGKNVDCLGWFSNEVLLADTLRRNGGFGLLWTEDFVWGEYMKYNVCAKLSTYLAAGLPVIVSETIPAAGMIREKNLGLVVKSLDEAVQRIECMTEEQYDQMVSHAASLGELLRGGYFTKKLLIDAVFILLCE